LVRDAAGNFYGSTCCGGSSGRGVIFMLGSSGNFMVLHNFNGIDGYEPQGNLVLDSAGNLYGTTQTGGSSGEGVVFKLDKAGNETVLVSFSGKKGKGPLAGLTEDGDGDLFGTTCCGGGSKIGGVVFKVDAIGNETVLHRFAGPEGFEPSAGLARDSAGNLYGTTYGGGSGNSGVVFELTH
jgi:uncharacterized repeat protein (TIGR03803 family)